MSITKISIGLIAFVMGSIVTYAQSSGAEINNPKILERTILRMDSLFWKAYNACDIENMSEFFTDDVEFYHDKGGLTTTNKELMSSVKNGLCSNKDFYLRREAVPGSVQVFPLQKSNITYGAILSGQHVFYINEKGKPEILDGLARFTHVWIQVNNAWKMSRILSYDHGPAPESMKKR